MDNDIEEEQVPREDMQAARGQIKLPYDSFAKFTLNDEREEEVRQTRALCVLHFDSPSQSGLTFDF
jgi:hypothetical protein